MKDIRVIPENTEKGLHAMPADFWPLHGVRGVQVSHFFSRSCCIGFSSICKFKFDRQMSSGVNDQANDLQFAAFRDHGWGHVALCPR